MQTFEIPTVSASRALSCASAVCQYEIVDLRHFILRGSLFRGTCVWLIKNQHATALQILNVSFEKEESP